MKTFIISLLFLLTTPLVAEDFDGWYFDYHAASVTITGEFFSPDGARTATVTGTRTGKLSPDGQSFTETSHYKFKPGDIKSSQSIEWKRAKKDGSFTGTSTDPKGVKVSYQLLLGDKNKLRIESKSLDGRTLIERGELKTDGKIYI